MKKMMLLSLLSLVSFMKADQQDIEKTKNEANVITYTVKVYCTPDHDQEQWNKIVDQAIKAIEKGNAAQTDDMVIAFVRGIESLYSRTKKGVDGIHGEMTISISDGSKPCCGDNCKCITRGACPCTDEVNCAQK